jgi:hypothetical protein
MVDYRKGKTTRFEVVVLVYFTTEVEELKVKMRFL